MKTHMVEEKTLLSKGGWAFRRRWGSRKEGLTHTYVCWDCRRAFSGKHKCCECGKDTMNLGWKPKIPKRKDDRGWAKLASIYRRWPSGPLTDSYLLEMNNRRKHPTLFSKFPESQV